MKKRGIIFLETISLMIFFVFPTGITAYAEDIMITDNALTVKEGFEEPLVDVASVTDENIELDVPREDDVIDVLQENVASATEEQQAKEVSLDESVEEAVLTDEIVVEDSETEEIEQDVSVEGGIAPDLDTTLTVGDIEVVNETDIQMMAMNTLEVPTLSIGQPISYELTADNSSLTYNINVEPGDYVICDSNFNETPCLSMELYINGRYEGFGSPLSFTAVSGAQYSVNISTWFEKDNPVVTGTLSIEKKKDILSVAFSHKDSYDVFDPLGDLDLSATITYEDGTEEIIGCGDWWSTNRCLEKKTQSGNTIYVLFYRGGQQIDVGSDGNNVLPAMLPVGTFDLKVISKFLESETTVENVINGSITITPPSSVNMTKITSTPMSYSLRNDSLSESYYYIPAQESEKALHVAFAEGEGDGINLCDFFGKDVRIFVYGKKDGTDDLYILSQSGIVDEDYSERKKLDTYCRLDKGKEYWVVLNGYDNINRETPIGVTLSLEEPQSVTSISITGVNDFYSINDINHTLGLTWNLRVHVEYNAEDDAEDITVWDNWQEYIDGDEIHYHTGKTKYQDTVIVKLENSEGSLIDFPDNSNIIVPGTYKLIACIKETGLQSQEQSFTVEDNGVTVLASGQEYPIDFSEDDDWRLFSYTPAEDGKYVFSFSQGEDNKVALYDSLSHLIYSDRGGISARLKKGQTYYYCAYSKYSGIHTTVKFTEITDVTEVTLESPPIETVYEIKYDEEYDWYYVNVMYEGIKVRVHYSDGSSQVIDVYNNDRDKLGNYIELGLCPLNADGSPDLSKVKSIWYDAIDPSETGNYALLAGVGEWNENDELFFPVAPAWVKVVIVPEGHVHSWSAPAIEVKSTCTTEGKQSIRCSSCGAVSTEVIPKLEHLWSDPVVEVEPTCTMEGKKIIFCKNCGTKKDDSTITIPKLAHSWGDWSIATQGQVALTRTCTVCHASETKNFSPVLSLTAKKLTMKTKQSTTKFRVTAMAEYDSLVSVESNNTKVLQVSNVTADGTFKLKAQNKTGTAKLTITLKSGATKTVKVKIQKAKVKTTRIGGLKKKLALKVKQKIKLAPVITPVTSQDKVQYTSSNKKVVAVTSKGQITAKKKGTATIIVKAGTKKTKIKVTVK